MLLLLLEKLGEQLIATPSSTQLWWIVYETPTALHCTASHSSVPSSVTLLANEACVVW